MNKKETKKQIKGQIKEQSGGRQVWRPGNMLYPVSYTHLDVYKRQEEYLAEILDR